MAAQPDWRQQTHQQHMSGDRARLERRLRLLTWPPLPDSAVQQPVDELLRHMSGEEPIVSHRRFARSTPARLRALADLIEAVALREDDEAQAEIYERYRTDVYRLLRRRTDSHHEAEDLTQGVFERAFSKLTRDPRLMPEANKFWPWLAQLAVNHQLNHIQKRGRSRTMDPADVLRRLDERDHMHPPELGWLSDHELEASVSRLGDRQRDVITLRYRDDLTNPQIAELLDASEQSVRKAHSLALGRLQERWSATAAAGRAARGEPRLPATARARRRHADSGITLLSPGWARQPAWGHNAGRGF